MRLSESSRRISSTMTTVNSNLTFQPSRNCPACGFPLAPGAVSCTRCASSAAPLATPFPTGPARFRHLSLSALDRFIAIAFDLFLAVITAGVGWVVWTAILAKKAQTPAKRLRDHVVIRSRTGQVAGVGRFLSREIITIAMFAYIAIGALWGFGLIIDVGGYWINSWVIPGVILGAIAVDLLWIFLPPRRRLIDVILGTNVVAGDGYSYQESTPTSGGSR